MNNPFYFGFHLDEMKFLEGAINEGLLKGKLYEVLVEQPRIPGRRIGAGFTREQAEEMLAAFEALNKRLEGTLDKIKLNQLREGLRIQYKEYQRECRQEAA